MKKFPLNAVSAAIFSFVFIMNATAQESLETINVVDEKPKDRRDNEVTGLGKLVKNAEQLNREQVLNIRDLTRYDPGISVVEQGRGASSGYSIRGMDRNRVALLVDGLPQSQSYRVQNPMTFNTYAGTGAINEIEYENLKAIEISKGSASSEYGNGALAGAVSFQSKNVNDVLLGGKNWGVQSKNAYSSKNKGWTHSLAFGGKNLNEKGSGFEGLVIYTRRHAHETAAHKDAIRGVQSYTRWTAEPKDVADYFILQDECPSGDYASCKANAKMPAEMMQKRETVSVSDYTGPNRIKPNPLAYRSDSWFTRGGYRVNERHYLGAIFEHTKQRYDSRDMTVPVYLSAAEQKAFNSRGIYHGTNYGEYHHTETGFGLAYGRGLFLDEHHKKTRLGVEYVYENVAKNGVFDHAQLSFDHQHIALNSFMQRTHCASYPNVDKNCRADVKKPYSNYFSDRHLYHEQHNVAQFKWDKTLQKGWFSQQFSSSLGVDFFQSRLKHSDFVQESVSRNWDTIRAPKGEPLREGLQSAPYFFVIYPNQLVRKDYCDYSGANFNYSACNERKIYGKNWHFALRDNMSFGDYVDFGIGARYDDISQKSNDAHVSVGHYRNLSWNSGIVLKPLNWLEFSYRISNGFRTPDFAEMFGWRAGHSDITKTNFRPERSRNQEAGIAFKGEFGRIEASYFSNAYRDLISFAEERDKNGKGKGNYGYFNAQNAKLVGVNVLAQVDWHNVWQKVPYGIYSTLAYNRIKVKDRHVNPNLMSVSNNQFDAIQPERYVIGLGYDSPSEIWGVNMMLTHSKGKKNDELLANKAVGGNNKTQKASGKRTRSWHTVDLSGYYTWKQTATLRLGVYNLFNYRYVTWEAVRQSAVGAINQHYNVGDYTRYAAPGRNFVATLELKF